MGSSALNLCYVAAGRIDAYWAKDTKTWDVAAGWLLVREAGGILTDLSGGEIKVSATLLCSNSSQASRLTSGLRSFWDKEVKKELEKPRNEIPPPLREMVSGLRDTLTFEIIPIEGDLRQADGPATLFIDIINLPIARRTARRSAWYAGAKQP